MAQKCQACNGLGSARRTGGKCPVCDGTGLRHPATATGVERSSATNAVAPRAFEPAYTPQKTNYQAPAVPAARPTSGKLLSHAEFARLTGDSALGRAAFNSSSRNNHPFISGSWEKEDFDGVDFYRKAGSTALCAVWIPGYGTGREQILARIGLPSLLKGSPRVLVDIKLAAPPE